MDIRLATVGDIDELIRVRQDFNDELHPRPDDLHAELADQLRTYLPERIASDQFAAVLGYVDGTLASAAFLLVIEYPANCPIPHGRVGLLLNVYTYPQYRRRGLGGQVVAAAIDRARELGLDAIDLEATDLGRGLYAQMGFEVRENTPMRLVL